MPDRRKKICVVVASRANLARITTVLEAVRDHPALKLQVIAAASALLERVKQSELDMEQLQTLALYGLVGDGNDEGISRSPVEQKDDALNNLTVYFGATGIKPDPLAQTHIMRILTAIFGA